MATRSTLVREYLNMIAKLYMVFLVTVPLMASTSSYVSTRLDDIRVPSYSTMPTRRTEGQNPVATLGSFFTLISEVLIDR